MKKSLIYTIAVVAVVVVIGAFVFFNNKAGAPTNGSGSPAPGSSTASLKELFAQGKSQKCTFSHDGSGVGSSGTVYIASGKMRGDFNSTVDGKTVESHMIVNGDTAYIWSSSMPQGIKMQFDAAAQAGQGNSGAVNPDQRFGYDCSGWSADQSLFSLPSGITFTDLGAAAAAAAGTSAGGAGAAGGASAYCSYCNQITDASAKAQCKAMYKCQ